MKRKLKKISKPNYKQQHPSSTNILDYLCCQTCLHCWTCWNPLERAFATLTAFWSLVGIATVNFMKTSVSTNTFSRPSDAGSIWVKSMARTSSGLVAIMLFMPVFCYHTLLTLGDPAFHFCMHPWSPALSLHNLLCLFWPLVSKVIMSCLQNFTPHSTWYYQKLLWLAITVVYSPAQHTILLCDVL